MKQATTVFYAGQRLVAAGEIVADNDPVIAGREHLFTEVAPTHPVETATAAPGEKRNRPAKKKAAKKNGDAPPATDDDG